MATRALFRRWHGAPTPDKRPMLALSNVGADRPFGLSLRAKACVSALGAHTGALLQRPGRRSMVGMA